MDNDSINKEFYNAFGNEFDKIPFGHILPQLILKYLPNSNCKILEIGSGAGALAHWISSLGCDMTCLEPAEKPAKSAREKGLNVHSVRFQDYQIDEKFDLAIAISSLIHIPKEELPTQINRIASCLKPEGLFLASFLIGDGEGLEDPTNKGKQRFFSKFTQEEVKELLSSNFSIIESYPLEVKKMNHSFLLLVLRLCRREM